MEFFLKIGAFSLLLVVVSCSRSVENRQAPNVLIETPVEIPDETLPNKPEIPQDTPQERERHFYEAREVIQSRCLICHTHSTSSSKRYLGYQTEPEFVAAGFFVPGKPDLSPIVNRLVGYPSPDADMPLKIEVGAKPFSKEEFEVISRWVARAVTENTKTDFLLSRSGSIQSLPYEALLKRLISVVERTAPNQITELRVRQFELGGYNFTQGILPNLTWTPAKQRIWLVQIAKSCNLLASTKNYPYPEKYADFFQRALGRPLDAIDIKQQEAVNARTDLSNQQKFEALCTSILTRVEFVAPLPAAISGTTSPYLSYARALAPLLAGRSLTENEAAEILQNGEAAIAPLIDSWTSQPYFAESFRGYVETLVSTGGMTPGEVNRLPSDSPSHLAYSIATEKLPYAELITSQTCRDGNENPQEVCDSKAPFNSGILTTRAYLQSHRGRFNLGRAGALLRQFACMEYPIPSHIEPRVPIQDLIPMFQYKGVGPLPGGAPTGNGTNCYMCHGQFSAHSQLFVKFDNKGMWRVSGTGAQDPDREPGVSPDGFYTSHFEKLDKSSDESSQYFGKPVANLREAATTLTESPLFLECAIRNLLRYYLRATDEEAARIPSALLKQIRESALKENKNPSPQVLIRLALSRPEAIHARKKK